MSINDQQIPHLVIPSAEYYIMEVKKRTVIFKTDIEHPAGQVLYRILDDPRSCSLSYLPPHEMIIFFVLLPIMAPSVFLFLLRSLLLCFLHYSYTLFLQAPLHLPSVANIIQDPKSETTLNLKIKMNNYQHERSRKLMTERFKYIKLGRTKYTQYLYVIF